MRHLIIAATALFLAACAPEIVYKPVPVQIPVSVPCKAPAVAVPILSTASVSANDPMFNQVKALAETNEQRQAYEAKLVAALKACQ